MMMMAMLMMMIEEEEEEEEDNSSHTVLYGVRDITSCGGWHNCLPTLGSALSSGSVFLQVITRSSVIIKINSPPFAVKFHFVKPAGNDWLSFTCCRFCKSCYWQNGPFFMGNVPIYETKIKFLGSWFDLGAWFLVGTVIEYIVVEFLCICR